MEILGIGPTELLFIFIIALILLGPKDMQKAGQTIGKWMNKVVTSDWWRTARETSRELSQLPTRLMREANLAEAELRQTMAETNPALPKPEPRPDSATENNTITPPRSQPSNTEKPPQPRKATETRKTTGAKKKPAAKKTLSSPKKTNNA